MQKSNHLTKHFYAELSAEIAPLNGSGINKDANMFECHLCQHVATDRNSLLRHVGAQHNLVDKYLDNYLKHKAVDTPTTSKHGEKQENNNTETADGPSYGNPDLMCRLCEKPTPFRLVK